MKILNITLASLLTLGCSMAAQAQQTKLLTADKHNEYGLVYTLPTTALRIDVTAKRTVKKAGPYFQYSKKYIGTDKVIREDTESWEITKVEVTPYGVPDNENRYLMQLKNGAVTYICVDEDGMLLAINKEVTAPEAVSGNMAETREGKEAVTDLNEYLQYVNEDFIASQSSAKRAQMLAESLMEIRDAKISLTRGTAETMPTDGKQLELMLNSLSHQEAALTAAFVGLTTEETVTRSYTFTPEKDGKTTLFRMSDFAGFVGADDYSGAPVYLNVKVTNRGTLPVDAKGEEKKLPKDAVIYNVPGAAKITLSLNGEELYAEEYEFSQFGVKFGLAPSLFSSKKERSFATFNPVTGGLTEIGQDAE